MAWFPKFKASSGVKANGGLTDFISSPPVEQALKLLLIQSSLNYKSPQGESYSPTRHYSEKHTYQSIQLVHF